MNRRRFLAGIPALAVAPAVPLPAAGPRVRDIVAGLDLASKAPVVVTIEARLTYRMIDKAWRQAIGE